MVLHAKKGGLVTQNFWRSGSVSVPQVTLEHLGVRCIFGFLVLKCFSVYWNRPTCKQLYQDFLGYIVDAFNSVGPWVKLTFEKNHWDPNVKFCLLNLLREL